MRVSFLGLIGVFSSCTCIVVASDESLKEGLRGFLGDTIPDVPFKVAYAEDIFQADVKADYSNGEDSEWRWDQEAMAPIMITNFRVHNHYGRYKYIYAYNKKDPDVPWSFLKNVKYVDDWWPKPNYFKVEKMDEEEALTKLDSLFKKSKKKAVMFFIHGWNYDPYDNFQHIKDGTAQSEYLFIPIMWNTDRGTTTSLDYRYDRIETAPRAAIQLAKIESFFSRVEQKKGWLCHSMGCYVTQFFASEINDLHPSTAANIFDIVFMVAPDLRYDIFNEYPFKSGKDKNECGPDSWKKGIPDCRAGGGKALVKLVKGGVDGTNKLRVLWNPKDITGPMRQFRLSMDGRVNWPLSPLGLQNQGDESNRRPLPYFKDKVEFTKIVDFGSEHSFTFKEKIIAIYDKAL